MKSRIRMRTRTHQKLGFCLSLRWVGLSVVIDLVRSSQHFRVQLKDGMARDETPSPFSSAHR
jgi:hypothetical protein